MSSSTKITGLTFVVGVSLAASLACLNEIMSTFGGNNGRAALFFVLLLIAVTAGVIAAITLSYLRSAMRQQNTQKVAVETLAALDKPETKNLYR